MGISVHYWPMAYWSVTKEPLYLLLCPPDLVPSYFYVDRHPRSFPHCVLNSGQTFKSIQVIGLKPKWFFLTTNHQSLTKSVWKRTTNRWASSHIYMAILAQNGARNRNCGNLGARYAVKHTQCTHMRARAHALSYRLVDGARILRRGQTDNGKITLDKTAKNERAIWRFLWLCRHLMPGR